MKQMHSMLSKTSISSMKHNGNNSTNSKRLYVQRPKELPPSLPKFYDKKPPPLPLPLPHDKNNFSFDHSYSTESTLSVNDSLFVGHQQQQHQQQQQQQQQQQNFIRSTSSPRHSVISNNSSNVSSPPSPIQLESSHNYSSSYDS